MAQFVAFYCTLGDFMVYDDGDNSLLGALAENFGPSIMGVVLAHEFGHAIQFRAGDLDSGFSTILTEQQADCFAGAWVSLGLERRSRRRSSSPTPTSAAV